MRLSVVVEERVWRELREAAASERTERGRASMNALVNRLIRACLAKRRRKGGT
jgi:hypothetical protein